MKFCAKETCTGEGKIVRENSNNVVERIKTKSINSNGCKGLAVKAQRIEKATGRIYTYDIRRYSNITPEEKDKLIKMGYEAVGKNSTFLISPEKYSGSFYNLPIYEKNSLGNSKLSSATNEIIKNGRNNIMRSFLGPSWNQIDDSVLFNDNDIEKIKNSEAIAFKEEVEYIGSDDNPGVIGLATISFSNGISVEYSVDDEYGENRLVIRDKDGNRFFKNTESYEDAYNISRGDVAKIIKYIGSNGIKNKSFKALCKKIPSLELHKKK